MAFGMNLVETLPAEALKTAKGNQHCVNVHASEMAYIIRHQQTFQEEFFGLMYSTDPQPSRQHGCLRAIRERNAYLLESIMRSLWAYAPNNYTKL